jgi:hypothetical protein
MSPGIAGGTENGIEQGLDALLKMQSALAGGIDEAQVGHLRSGGVY